MRQSRSLPSTQRAYDVCVVGSQLGGISAGALLARRGFRVLHVDHDGLGGHYEDHGWLLPYAPALLPSPRNLPASEAVLSELGLTPDLGRQLEPCVPDLQLLLPRHRLDLSRDAAPRLAELRREWPSEASRIEASIAEALRLCDAERPFLAARPPLPPSGVRERWQLSRALRLSPGAGEESPEPLSDLGDHPLAMALRSTYPFLAHLDGAPPRLGLTRVLGSVLRGTYRLADGEVGLREIVRQRIADSRGDLLGSADRPAIAESLEFSRGRVTAVRLAGSDDVYLARAFVSATDTAALRRIVPGGGERLAAQLDQVRPARRLLSVNWVVGVDALPAPLGPTALAVGTAADGPGPVLLQVLPARRAGKKAAGGARPGERVLSAATFVPVRGREREEELIAAHVSRLRGAVAEFLPFLDDLSNHSVRRVLRE